MMTGDTVRDRGVTFEVVWSGQRSDPSLLQDYARPSPLALLLPDRRQARTGRQHVSPRARDGQLVGAKRDRRWRDRECV